MNNSEQERAAVVHAAVNIANELGYSTVNKLDACHEVAKRVLGMFPNSLPSAVLPVELVDNVVPINRRQAEDNPLLSEYDVVRLRSAASARAMFGVPEAA